MATVLLAFGLVLIVEGLVYALAPSIVERLLEEIRNLPTEQRRFLGLIALGIGVALVWLARALGA